MGAAGSVVGDEQVLCLAVVAVLKADTVGGVEGRHPKMRLAVEPADGGRVLDDEQESRGALGGEVAGQPLVVGEVEVVAGVGAEVAVVGRVYEDEIAGAGAVPAQECLEVQVFDDDCGEPLAEGA